MEILTKEIPFVIAFQPFIIILENKKEILLLLKCIPIPNSTIQQKR